MNWNPLLTNSTNEITAIPTPIISSITSGNKRRCSRKAPDDPPFAKRPCNSAPKKLTPVRGPRKQMQARKSSSPPEKDQACSPQEQTQQQQVSVVQSTMIVYRFPNGPTTWWCNRMEELVLRCREWYMVLELQLEMEVLNGVLLCNSFTCGESSF
ncbi:hypothetical protein MKW98_023031 [Papaver atlanticum]|uniref:Uncharacterized protein n=1 Tax=Papaver atlanticum TaxID=357466 RepID=A0AAD4XT40_9MAGN|nr:hypothetical protein MKW98_023031 [Papaver atlanticum]